jgi:aspartyl-tRNA(Asn)/glutamyl-tRNA(Gln) amidotransferase subunit C
VEPTAHVLPVHNVLRTDESRPSPGPDAVLHNAPEKQETYFRVPKVLDQDSA